MRPTAPPAAPPTMAIMLTLRLETRLYQYGMTIGLVDHLPRTRIPTTPAAATGA
jgi:hypothetical protein